MSEVKMYRQGEVLIRRLNKDETPDYKSVVSQYNNTPAYTPRKNGVIVEGEQTGHMHAVDKGVLYEKKAERWNTPEQLFFHTEETAELTHDEHATIKLPKGDYEITFQREYDENNRHRRVID